MTETEHQGWRDYDPTRGLSALSADELAQRLKEHVEGCGPFIAPSDLEVARECVRRARQAEAAEAAALELLEELRALSGRLACVPLDHDVARTATPGQGYRPSP